MPRLPLVILIVALVTASGLTLSEGRKSLRPLSKNLSSFRGASSSSSASFEASKDHLINSRSGLAHFQAAESTLNAVITDANNERDLSNTACGSSPRFQGASQSPPARPTSSSFGKRSTSSSSSTSSISTAYSATSSTNTTSATATLDFNVDSYASKAAFTSDVCDRLMNTLGTGHKLFFYGARCTAWELPACIKNYPILNVTSTTCVTINSFVDQLPPVLNVLILINATYALPTSPPPAPGAIDGFKDDGTVSWAELWGYLTGIQTMKLIGGNLRGSLPSGEVWKSLTWLEVTHQNLSGLVPAGLFFFDSDPSQPFPLVVDFSYNNLTGSVPTDLFTPTKARKIGSLRFDLSHNKLSGSLVSPLLDLPNALSSLDLNLGHNNLNGSILASFFQNIKLSGTYTLPILSFNIANNRFTGSIPATAFDLLPQMSSLRFNASQNLLQGSLPSKLASSWRLTSELIFDISSNQISGTIPATLVLNSLSSNLSFSTLSLNLRNNSLISTLPGDLFRNNNFYPRVGIFNLDVAYNQLSGSLPPSLLNGVLTASTTLASLNVGSNTMNGPFPSAILTSAPTGLNMTVNASNNAFTVPPSACGLARMDLDLSNNKMSSDDLFAGWSICLFTQLRVSNNPALRGVIPSGFLNNTNLVVFQAANTGLTGDLPSYHPSLAEVDLSSTSISFCSSASRDNFGTFNAICNLGNTTACRECQAYYTSSCISACVPLPPSSPPSSLPPSPNTSPSAPVPRECPGRSPGPEFSCSDGIWVAPSTDEFVLVIPPSSGPVVVVSGNVSSSQIVFSGIGSLISIGGCATNLTSIVIELTQEEAKEIGKLGRNQSLITLADALGCGMDLNDIVVSVKNADGCRKTTSKKLVSDDNKTLGALFTVDSSGCRTWWIILVSVLGGVVVLAVIVIVLMAIFWPAFRLKLRPYSVKRGGDKAAV